MRNFKYNLSNLNTEMKTMLDFYKNNEEFNDGLNGAVEFYALKNKTLIKNKETLKIAFRKFFNIFIGVSIVILLGVLCVFIAAGVGFNIDGIIVGGGLLYVLGFCVLFPLFNLVEKKLQKQINLFYNNMDIIDEMNKLRFQRL